MAALSEGDAYSPEIFCRDGEIVVRGVCYKEGSSVPIVEESCKLEIARLVRQTGRQVVIHDTEELVGEVRKEYGDLFQYRSESP